MDNNIEGSIIAHQQVEIETLKERIAQLESQLPEGMKHCTITFHQCPKGHAWLSATNWIQHGCSKCERDALEAQSFNKLVEREFKKNLELAKEEIRDTDPDAYDLAQGYVKDDYARSAWNMANEWTCDDISNQIACLIDRMWWEKQDAINKAYYD